MTLVVTLTVTVYGDVFIVTYQHKLNVIPPARTFVMSYFRWFINDLVYIDFAFVVVYF